MNGLDAIRVRVLRSEYPRLVLLSIGGAGVGLIGTALVLVGSQVGSSLDEAGLRIAVIGYLAFLVGVSGYVAFAVFENRFD